MNNGIPAPSNVNELSEGTLETEQLHFRKMWINTQCFKTGVCCYTAHDYDMEKLRQAFNIALNVLFAASLPIPLYQ